MKIVMDAFAWVEYLGGYNRDLQELVEKNDLHTSIFNVAEVASKAERSGIDSGEIISAINQMSRIHDADLDAVRRVGQLHAKMRKSIKDFGLGDCFVLELAERLDAKILTGDPHFKGLKNVILV